MVDSGHQNFNALPSYIIVHRLTLGLTFLCTHPHHYLQGTNNGVGEYTEICNHIPNRVYIQ